MNNMIKEISLALVLLLFSFVFFNPYFMPESSILTTLMCFLVVFGIFIGLLWKERGGDERDIFHRNISDRFAYIVGIIVIVAGIVIEVYLYMHADKWLLLSFITMVMAKIAGLMYSKYKH